MQSNIDKKQLQSFGFTVGGVFALIGLWPVVFRAEGPKWWAVVFAVCMLVPAAVYPRSLFWVHRGWMWLGHVLGWVNTRIILGIVFYVIVTPIGMLRRWLGKDPMGRELRPDVDTYRIPRTSRPASHLKRQY